MRYTLNPGLRAISERNSCFSASNNVLGECIQMAVLNGDAVSPKFKQFYWDKMMAFSGQKVTIHDKKW